VRVAGYWADKLEDPLALISPFVTDENPHVRLEAVRALAQVASPQAVVLAARVLDKRMDPFLDYALWLTCNELKDTWLPGLQAGKLTGWESADQLNYALKAVKSPEAVKSLVAQLKSGQTPQAARAGVIDLIADIGGADEANVLLEMATANELKDRASQRHLLDSLLKLARRQHVTPNDPGRVKSLLGSEDAAVRATALRLAAAWKLEDLRPQIQQAAEAAYSPPVTRQAAMQALADLGGPASLESLRKLSDAPNPPMSREAAIAALASLDVKDAAERAAGFLAEDGKDPSPLINALLDRESGSAALAEALRNHKLPPDAAKLALRAVRNAGKEAPALSDVLTQLTGASSDAVRLSPEQMKQAITEVQQKGDAARGEEVFRRAETGCYQCHSIAGAGGWLAPDISSIGASSPIDYIIESILDPNKAIKDGYQGYTVVTKSGEIYSGIKIRQDNNQIVLRDNTHFEIPIPIADVKQQKDAGSLMPNGLASTITHQEFIDVVRFLSELGKPGPYGPTNAQYVRTWKVMTPVPDALASESPENVSMGEIDRQAWNPTYSLVSGVLPVDALAPAKSKPLAYARGEINVTAAGTVRLVLNSPKGISIWVDGKPAKAEQEITLDLPTGTHALLFRIDLSDRGNEGLRVEVADAPGSSGHAQPMNGK
jgi:putative heme-binding domain-containing protein